MFGLEFLAPKYLIEMKRGLDEYHAKCKSMGFNKSDADDALSYALEQESSSTETMSVIDVAIERLQSGFN